MSKKQNKMKNQNQNNAYEDDLMNSYNYAKNNYANHQNNQQNSHE